MFMKKFMKHTPPKGSCISSMRPNYFVGLDIHCPSPLLVDEITRVRTTMMTKNAKLQDAHFVNSSKLHITLGLCRVKNEELLPRISTILYEVAVEMRDLFRSPHSTRIIFDTLHYFPLDGEKGYQQNKRKKRVVYLKPTEDSTKILKLYSSAVLEAVQKERLDDVFDFQPSDALHLTLCKTRNMLIHRSDLNDLTIEKPLVTDCRFVRLYKIGSANGSGGHLSYGGAHFIEEDFDRLMTQVERAGLAANALGMVPEVKKESSSDGVRRLLVKENLHHIPMPVPSSPFPKTKHRCLLVNEELKTRHQSVWDFTN